MHTAIVEIETLRIASHYVGSAPNQGAYGGPCANPELFSHLEIPSEIDPMYAIAQLDGETIIIIENVEAKAASVLAGQMAEAQKYLDDTDWIMTKISEELLIRNGDKEALETKYAVQLAQREVSRQFIRDNR